MSAVAIIQGHKYILEIVSEELNFAIKAQCKSTKRYSYINNLNAILSEFEISINDPKATESTWEVSKYEANKLAEIIKEALADSTFLHYLEKQLDLDRELGEWENSGE